MNAPASPPPGRWLLALPLAFAVPFLLASSCGSGDERTNRARTLTGGEPDRGKVAVVRFGCAGCHQISGVRENGNVGPPLTSFSERAFIAGKLPNTPENFVGFVRQPHGVRPAGAMPETGVGSQDARDIAAYVYAQP